MGYGSGRGQWSRWTNLPLLACVRLQLQNMKDEARHKLAQREATSNEQLYMHGKSSQVFQPVSKKALHHALCCPFYSTLNVAELDIWLENIYI